MSTWPRSLLTRARFSRLMERCPGGIMVLLPGPIYYFGSLSRFFFLSFSLPRASIDGFIVCAIAFLQYPTAVEIVSTDIDTRFPDDSETTISSASARLQEVLSASVCGYGKDCASNHHGSSARVLRIWQGLRFLSPSFVISRGIRAVECVTSRKDCASALPDSGVLSLVCITTQSSIQ